MFSDSLSDDLCFNPLAQVRADGGYAQGLMESGIIRSVNTGRGTVEVSTSSGRRVTCTITQQGGAAGQGASVTPLAGSFCLIVMFGSERAYLLATYRVQSTDGEATVPHGAPGDQLFLMSSGGHQLMTQGGLYDLQVDPWCRFTMMPRTQSIRFMARNLEVQFSPLSTVRVTQDIDTKSQFAELFFDSRFMGRADTTPDIQIVLGDTVTSDKVHPNNPRSPFLAYVSIDARKRTTPDSVRTTTLGIGDVLGVGVEVKTVNVEEQTTVTQQTGHFGEGQDGKILSQETYTFEGGQTTVTVEASGRVTVLTPGSILNLGPEGEITVANEETQVLITGADIYVGGEEGAQKMAKGDDLLARIEGIEAFLKTHTHLHPYGPTGASIAQPTEAPAFLSENNHVV